MKYLCPSCMLLLVITLLSPKAMASELDNSNWLDKIALHGFGSWVYGQTSNQNEYFLGGWDADGHGNYFNFSLNIRAEISENLTGYLQPSFDEINGEQEATVDYVFAEWYLSDYISLRAGKIKIPLMLMNEIHDVGTVRPFFLLPTGIYEDFSSESYQGIGSTGILFLDFENEWQVTYDIYGGFIDIEEKIIKKEVARFSIENMIGGRLFFQPPIDGLRFGISGYTGEHKKSITKRGDINTDPPSGNYYLLGGSIEYLNDSFEFRTEYASNRETDDNMQNRYNNDTYYAEMAYRLNDQWQVAVRYEVLEYDTSPQQDSVTPENKEESKELTLGLNYWVRPNLVVKCSTTFIQGNLNASPENDAEFRRRGNSDALVERTVLGLFGVQFSF